MGDLEFVIVFSDGEDSGTVSCSKEQITSVIQELLKDEYLLTVTIVRVLTEEQYES